ncbi:unnamed protein product, partial [Prorocentrum cordatum]
ASARLHQARAGESQELRLQLRALQEASATAEHLASERQQAAAAEVGELTEHLHLEREAWFCMEEQVPLAQEAAAHHAAHAAEVALQRHWGAQRALLEEVEAAASEASETPSETSARAEARASSARRRGHSSPGSGTDLVCAEPLLDPRRERAKTDVERVSCELYGLIHHTWPNAVGKDPALRHTHVLEAVYRLISCSKRDGPIFQDEFCARWSLDVDALVIQGLNMLSDKFNERDWALAIAERLIGTSRTACKEIPIFSRKRAKKEWRYLPSARGTSAPGQPADKGGPARSVVAAALQQPVYRPVGKIWRSGAKPGMSRSDRSERSSRGGKEREGLPAASRSVKSCTASNGTTRNCTAKNGLSRGEH